MGCTWMEPIFPKSLVESYPDFNFEEWTHFLASSGVLDILEIFPLSCQFILMPAMAFERFLFVCYSTSVKIFYTKARRIIFFAIALLSLFLLPGYHLWAHRMYGVDHSFERFFGDARASRQRRRVSWWDDPVEWWRWRKHYYIRWGGTRNYHDVDYFFNQYMLRDLNNVLFSITL